MDVPCCFYHVYLYDAMVRYATVYYAILYHIGDGDGGWVMGLGDGL